MSCPRAAGSRHAPWILAAALLAGCGPPPVSAPAGGQDGARLVAQAQVVPIEGVVEVRPLSEGRVLRVLVRAGERVAAGQLLAELESGLQGAALGQQRAAAAAAAARDRLAIEGARPEEQAALRAAADAARLQAEQARDHWERQQALYGRGFIAVQALRDAERQRDAAQALAREAELRAAAAAGGRPAELDRAQAELHSAQAAVQAGQVELQRTRIVAPAAGVVMTRSVDPGDVIAPSLTAPTLFRIVDPGRLEVRFEVEELLAPRLAVGLEVRYRLPGGGAVLGHGQVLRVAPQVEKRTIGADDARIRADTMVRPAWGDLQLEPGQPPLPVNYRLEAWVSLPPVGEPGNGGR